MNRPFLLAVSMLTSLTLATPLTCTAAGVPSAAEIAQARGQCAVQKHAVHELEAAGNDDANLADARLAWEHACAHAQALIDAAKNGAAGDDAAAMPPAH